MSKSKSKQPGLAKSNRNKDRKAFRDAGIDKKKMNPAGFYEGMPGVFLDELGNRRIFEVSMNPEGELMTRLGASAANITKCFKSVIEENPLTRQMMVSALQKHIIAAERKRFKNKLKKFFGMKTSVVLNKPAKKKEHATKNMNKEEYKAYVEKLDKEVDEELKQEKIDKAQGLKIVK